MNRMVVQGPPKDMVVRGRHSKYASVPAESFHTFFLEGNTPFRSTVIRAFRSRGWTKALSAEEAHFIWDKVEHSKRYAQLKSWQRYNHIPRFGAWDKKNQFAEGFKEYYNMHPTFTQMIPETYRLTDEQERQALEERLFKGGGLDEPWVLKEVNVNNGKGIEMLGPQSENLRFVLQDVPLKLDKGESECILQHYICNELTWWGNRKFDLRFYWLVASVDPLIVLYHDGYVRVGNSAYDETDWTTTQKHLTTHTYLANEDKGTVDNLKERLQEYYGRHAVELRARGLAANDIWQHIRKQIKLSIAQTVGAFRNRTFGNADDVTVAADNQYSMYGADFVIDKDLDVWYVEAQAGPGMEEEFDFRVELHRDLLRSKIDIVDEVQRKNINGESILPLSSSTGWEVVYAETGDSNQKWMFEYEDYRRLRNKKGCQGTPAS